MDKEPPFWKTKTLHEMDEQEWDALCDGCAKCCLVKLEDEETNEVFYTDIACRLLDCETCRCTDYPKRLEKVAGCAKITPDNIANLFWLPQSCAYRLVYEGQDLPDWHHLVCKDDSKRHEGHSIQGRCISENDFYAEAGADVNERLVDWVFDEPK